MSTPRQTEIILAPSASPEEVRGILQLLRQNGFVPMKMEKGFLVFSLEVTSSRKVVAVPATVSDSLAETLIGLPGVRQVST